MGAWDYGYYKYDEVTKKGTDGRENERLAAGIVAVKNELRYTGYAREAMVGDLPFYGSAVANSVKDLQAAKGLPVTGVLNPATSKELFRKRVEQEERNYGLTRGVLGKKIWLESLYDPICVGTRDPRDRGMCQINLKEILLDGDPGIHNVTLAQAYDPAFAIDWAAKYVNDQGDAIAARIELEKAARAAYNVGNYYASEWLKASFPPNGLVVNNVDWFARAYDYIANIDKQTW